MSYTDWKKEIKCSKCGGIAFLKMWDSSDGAHTDYHEVCTECDHTKWYEGSDA